MVAWQKWRLKKTGIVWTRVFLHVSERGTITSSSLPFATDRFPKSLKKKKGHCSMQDWLVALSVQVCHLSRDARASKQQANEILMWLKSDVNGFYSTVSKLGVLVCLVRAPCHVKTSSYLVDLVSRSNLWLSCCLIPVHLRAQTSNFGRASAPK